MSSVSSPSVNPWSDPKKTRAVLTNLNSGLDEITEGLSNLNLRTQGVFNTEVVNVHQDDIHALIHTSGHFVTGSKDTYIKIWDSRLVCKKSIPRTERSYEKWITALHPLSTGFLSGTRDGLISKWSENGDEIATALYWSQLPHISKDRNHTRIHCISSKPDDDSIFFTGTARCINLWKSRGSGIVHLYSAEVAKNDWVYCIHPLSSRKIVAVVGSDLNLYDLNLNQRTPITFSSSLIRENPQEVVGKQRPLISWVEPLAAHQLGLAVFSGCVKIFDLEKQRIVRTLSGHCGRVWRVLKVEESLIASCSDDGTIKLWDLRGPNQIQELGPHNGRVACMTLLNPKTLVATSCPDNVFRSEKKASFNLYDLRKV